MAARKVFGRVQLEYDSTPYMLELSKEGLRVWKKRSHLKKLMNMRLIHQMMKPQPELFLITKPKEKTTEGERAISELAQVHSALAEMTGCHSDGVNWRYMLQVLYERKDKS